MPSDLFHLSHGKLVLFSAAFAILDMLTLGEDIHTPIPNFHPMNRHEPHHMTKAPLHSARRYQTSTMNRLNVKLDNISATGARDQPRPNTRTFNTK